MARYNKTNGRYNIKGKVYPQLVGSRAQVYHGTAYKTSGGLKREQLLQNKLGRIVSRRKYNTARKEQRLRRYGYGTRKGKFGAVKLDGLQNRRRSKSRSRSNRRRAKTI